MNRRELLRDAGVAAAVASPLLAGSASQAQVPIARLNVLIAYHPVTGNTEKMAQGVAEGATGLSPTPTWF
jgi:NAD(P)H dehydrogenase (quinone)